jgi:pilus assembly protein CpaD
MTRTDPQAGAHRPHRLSGIAAAMMLAAALGACKTTETPDTVPFAYDLRERHPITIHEGSRTVRLFIGKRRAGLTSVQRNEVASFADNWHRDSTGGIIIRVPAGTPNERAARDTVSEIRGILAAGGVPPDGIAVQPLAVGDPAKLVPVVLEYPRMAATAGPCGLWPNDLGPGAGIDYLTNAPYYNLGCAQQRNLAAMVDNPADLVQPRAEDPAYEARRSVALDKYRKGENPATQNQDNEKAKISDVGK